MSSIKVHRVSGTVISGDGFSIETELDACEFIDPVVHVDEAGGKLIVVYAARDEYPQNPLKDFDGEGDLYTLKRRNSTLNDPGKVYDALGLNDEGRPDVEQIRQDLINKFVLGIPSQDVVAFGLSHRERFQFDLSDQVTLDEVRDKIGEYLVEGYGYADYWNRGYIGDLWLDILLKYQPIFDKTMVLPEWKERIFDGRLGIQYSVALDYVSHESAYETDIRVGMGIVNYVNDVHDEPNIDGVWIPENERGTLGNLLAWAKSEGVDPWDHAVTYAKGIVDNVAAWIDGRVYSVVTEIHELNDNGEYDHRTLTSSDELNILDAYGEDQAEKAIQEALKEAV